MFLKKLFVIFTVLILLSTPITQARAADYMPILESQINLYGIKPGMMLSEAKAHIEAQGGKFERSRSATANQPISRIIQSDAAPYFQYFAYFGEKVQSAGGRGKKVQQTKYSTYMTIIMSVYPTKIGETEDMSTLKIHTVHAEYNTYTTPHAEKNGALPIKVIFGNFIDLLNRKVGKVNEFSGTGQDSLTISLSNNNGLPEIAKRDLIKHKSVVSPRPASNACEHMRDIITTLILRKVPVPRDDAPMINEEIFRKHAAGRRNDFSTYDKWLRCGDVALFHIDNSPDRVWLQKFTQYRTNGELLFEAFKNFDATWRMK